MNIESLHHVLQSQINDQKFSQRIGEIIQESLSAVNPCRCIKNALHLEDGNLYVDHHRFPLDSYDRVVLLSIGKAANAMGRAVYGILGERLSDGILVCKTAFRSEDVFPTFITQFTGGIPYPTREVWMPEKPYSTYFRI